MGLLELQSLDLDALVGCRLTAQEAYVFLVNLNNVVAGAAPNDLPQVHQGSLNNFKIVSHLWLTKPQEKYPNQAFPHSFSSYGAELVNLCCIPTTHLRSIVFYIILHIRDGTLPVPLMVHRLYGCLQKKVLRQPTRRVS